MPQLGGELVEHTFRKTTHVGNTHVFFPGKVLVPKHVLDRHLMEKRMAKERKKRQDEQIGKTAEEVEALNAVAEVDGDQDTTETSDESADTE